MHRTMRMWRKTYLAMSWFLRKSTPKYWLWHKERIMKQGTNQEVINSPTLTLRGLVNQVVPPEVAKMKGGKIHHTFPSEQKQMNSMVMASISLKKIYKSSFPSTWKSNSTKKMRIISHRQWLGKKFSKKTVWWFRPNRYGERYNCKGPPLFQRLIRCPVSPTSQGWNAVRNISSWVLTLPSSEFCT